MKGNLFINGVDIFEQFGGFITDGGHAELIQFPDLKDVEINDWQEFSGIEVDLSDPKLNTKTFSIKMAFVSGLTNYKNFVAHISGTSYKEWNFANLGKTFRLRYSQSKNVEVLADMRKIEIELVDDFPLKDYTYQEPTDGFNTLTQDYELDGKQLSQYGISVIAGALAQLDTIASVKTNLLRTNNSISGAVYDGEYLVFKEKKVSLPCLMRTNNLPNFWRNWNAFLYDLTRPNVRTLYSLERVEEFPCYYNSCKIEEFNPVGSPWVKFSIDLTFIFVEIDGEELVLSTENDWIVITEDGDFAIDMKPNA